jgi:hypothetical protein
MENIKFKSFILSNLILCLCFFQAQINAQTPVKGENVTNVEIGRTSVEGTLKQTGPKTWTHYQENGQVFATYTETGRDEWSVYLNSPRFTSVIINLWLKTFVIKEGNSVFYDGKVLSSSSAEPTSINRSADIESARPSPLTNAEMSRVMNWISVKTSAARLPFCWRQSYGRTAGKPMICSPGYNQDTAGLCYKNCAADEKGIATFCYKNCPAGYADNGLYCGKPAAYGRGAGYPWKIGDKPFNLDSARDRCAKDNAQGCEQNGAIIYPKCKAGFHAVGSNICSPDCPQGWEDIGVSCKKPNYAREVKPLQTCPAGLEQDAALCYPGCKNDYKGVGPVCWQNCPSQQNVDCGAGCATTKGQCAKAVFTMTSAPIIAALKIAGLIVTAGGSSVATGGAAAASTGSKLLEYPKLAKLAQMATKIKDLYKANEQTIKVASATKTVITSLQSEVNLFSKEFADNFGDMTSPEIEKEIDARFSKEAALEIKKAWAVHHLSMMLEANVITTSKNFISVVGIADPTGLVGVVDAFLNPLCKDNTPFPTVNPKY